MNGPVLGLLLSATVAAAAEPNEISAGATTTTYGSYSRGSVRRFGLEVGYLRSIGPTLQVGGGLRTAAPLTGAAFPFEVFARGRLVARIGPWEPAAGPELGVSGYTNLDPPPGLPTDRFADEQARVSPLYLAFDAAPLRFRVLERFVVSALELQIGVTLTPPGAVSRLQLGLITVGGTL
jgi:hypothetical protein